MADRTLLGTGARILVTHGNGSGNGHDQASRSAVASRMASIVGMPFGGDYDPSADYAAPLYFVPSDAMASREARELGIRAADDLFGGVVPHPFVATKAITHPLVSARACAPEGWSRDFADEVRGAVLRGHTAFSREDARAAARELLRSGVARVKHTTGIGGGGQFVVSGEHELEAALAGVDDAILSNLGVVLEENLVDPETFSVGQVAIGELTMSYCGTQCATRNNRGAMVYGGSSLSIVRGGFEALRASPLPPTGRRAVELAERYDRAALRCYNGFFASRRNYDVAFGKDRDGQARIGVLEQSWRIGGASSAEVVALGAFRDDAALDRIRVASVERYGRDVEVPAGAFVYFRGDDPNVGALTKYAIVSPDEDAG